MIESGRRLRRIGIRLLVLRLGCLLFPPGFHVKPANERIEKLQTGYLRAIQYLVRSRAELRPQPNIGRTRGPGIYM